MAEVSIPPVVSALNGIAGTGDRFGRRDVAPGVTITEVAGLVMALVAARKGQTPALSAKVQELFGLALPDTPQRVAAGDVRAIWTGPDQWLVVFGAGGRERIGDLALSLQGLASVTDQSDSRAMIEVAGPRVRDALAKGVMLDLHPSVFRPGDTAATLVAHIGVQVTMIDATPIYHFLVPRSFCLSFWHWLTSASEEYGVEVKGKVGTRKA